MNGTLDEYYKKKSEENEKSSERNQNETRNLSGKNYYYIYFDELQKGKCYKLPLSNETLGEFKNKEFMDSGGARKLMAIFENNKYVPKYDDSYSFIKRHNKFIEIKCGTNEPVLLN